MATPTPRRSPQHRPAKATLEVVDPRWLLKALGIAIVAATVCAYLAVCLLIYQGGWQLMLHPSAKIDATPSVPFEAVRFDAAATGKPRLTGWWIPANPPAATSQTRTILFLHDGTGSLSASVPKLELLHRAGVNAFALDYRGFGQSDPRHPSEARMTEDAAAGLLYLADIRHIPAQQIVPYGEGLGAVLAANLANAHAELPAVIIDSPDPNAFAHAAGLDSGKARMLPMSLLLSDRFDIASALAAAKQSKLLLATGPFAYDAAHSAANQRLFKSVPDPKITVTFGSADSSELYLNAIKRFLDQ